MQGLTLNEIDGIDKAVKGKRVSKKKWGITTDGEKVSLTKELSVRVGKYEGKLGTTVRSAKGRTYRRNNGYTFYNNLESDIVAYMVRY